jgi:hypothetical protein
LSWARIDDGYYENPKVLSAGRDGRDLHLASIVWMAAHWKKQRGVIPSSVLPLLMTHSGVSRRTFNLAIRILEKSELWEVLASDGWLLHDWQKYVRDEDGSRVSARGRIPSRPVLSSSRSSVKQESLLNTEKDQDVELFLLWQLETGRTGTQFLAERRRLMRDRRKEGYSQEDLADAIRGWVNDPWPERRDRNDLKYLLKDGAAVERFRDFHRNGPPAQPVMNMLKAKDASTRAAGWRAVSEQLKAKQLKEAEN